MIMMQPLSGTSLFFSDHFEANKKIPKNLVSSLGYYSQHITEHGVNFVMGEPVKIINKIASTVIRKLWR